MGVAGLEKRMAYFNTLFVFVLFAVGLVLAAEEAHDYPLHTVVTMTTGQPSGLSQRMPRSICNGCHADSQELRKDIAAYLGVTPPYVDMLDYETFGLPGFTARARILDSVRDGKRVPGIVLAVELQRAVAADVVPADYRELTLISKVWIDTPEYLTATLPSDSASDLSTDDAGSPGAVKYTVSSASFSSVCAFAVATLAFVALLW